MKVFSQRQHAVFTKSSVQNGTKVGCLDSRMYTAGQVVVKEETAYAKHDRRAHDRDSVKVCQVPDESPVVSKVIPTLCFMRFSQRCGSQARQFGKIYHACPRGQYDQREKQVILPRYDTNAWNVAATSARFLVWSWHEGCDPCISQRGPWTESSPGVPGPSLISFHLLDCKPQSLCTDLGAFLLCCRFGS